MTLFFFFCIISDWPLEIYWLPYSCEGQKDLKININNVVDINILCYIIRYFLFYLYDNYIQYILDLSVIRKQIWNSCIIPLSLINRSRTFLQFHYSWTICIYYKPVQIFLWHIHYFKKYTPLKWLSSPCVPRGMKQTNKKPTTLYQALLAFS